MGKGEDGAGERKLALVRQPRTERELLATLPPRFRFDLAAAPPPADGAPAEAAVKASRTFTGLTAVYGNLFYRWSWEACDIVATVLEPGAFAKSIERINSQEGVRAGNIPLMWEHYLLLGRSLSLEDAPEGVRISARITDTPDLDRYAAFIGDGTVNGMSVGFNILASTVVKEADSDEEAVEHVTEAELGEITACLLGANPLAIIEAAASRGAGHYRERLAGKVLSSANQADLDCATEDIARVVSRAKKEDKQDDEDATATVRRDLAHALRQIEGLHLRIDTLEATTGQRKG